MYTPLGNNGLANFNYGPTAYQNYLYEAAGDAGILHFFGQNRTINSIVLLTNGVSFAIQTVIFLLLGAMADYGNKRPYILLFWTIVSFGIGWGVFHELHCICLTVVIQICLDGRPY